MEKKSIIKDDILNKVINNLNRSEPLTTMEKAKLIQEINQGITPYVEPKKKEKK